LGGVVNDRSALIWSSINPSRPKRYSEAMKTTRLWLLIAAVLLVGFALYRFQSRNNLNVTPEAREQIERAKRR